jgi:nucleoside diphosphate kinase
MFSVFLWTDRTLAIIKPDAAKQMGKLLLRYMDRQTDKQIHFYFYFIVGSIFDIIFNEGFKVCRAQMVHLTRQQTK